MFLTYTIVVSTVLTTVASYSTPNCHDDRSVIVHLFNWKHTDIARECEEVLGPKGYCGVQISPPSEHMVITNSEIHEHRPWWERYQTVSYNLETRSGTREQFIDMVNRCEAVNVRIYVDAVINHMTGMDAGAGTGSGGCDYDASALSFPCVPYVENDFNCCFASGEGNCDEGGGDVCYTSSCGVENDQDPDEIRNCRLFGLLEVAMGVEATRQKVRGYLSDLIDLGVAGFRVDIAKHMWPEDLLELFEPLTLPDGTQPFLYNEVADFGNDAVRGEEYFQTGRVTEFRGCNNLANAFRGFVSLSSLQNYGQEWGMYPSGNVLAFVDNHDNQRGHGTGGDNILTFYEPRLYKMAVVFTMAWPYGMVRITSSYRWPGGPDENDGYGPPTNDGEDIKNVTGGTGNCDDGSEHTWICEHRWTPIANMAQWRNLAGGEADNVEHWWDNGNNQIAFSRGGVAFLAINNEATTMQETLQTGLTAGDYCNVIDGEVVVDECSGSSVAVNADGLATIIIPGDSENPVVAIHIGAKLPRVV